jgi:hypothetical protein
MNWKRIAVTVSAVAVVSAVMAFAPSEAQARGHHGGVRVSVGGFYGYGPYFGLGWGYGYGPYYAPYWGSYYGPYYGPYARSTGGGIDPNVAMIAGLGGIDVNVKPIDAEVWVDGKYVGDVKRLGGNPSYLWLPEGTHHLQIRKGGYATFETQVDVRRGIVNELKLHLKPGESDTPDSAVPAPTGSL